jgi:hypothetical protein
MLVLVVQAVALVAEAVQVVVVWLPHLVELVVLVEVEEYSRELEALEVVALDRGVLVVQQEIMVVTLLTSVETWAEAEEAEAGVPLVV